MNSWLFMWFRWISYPSLFVLFVFDETAALLGVTNACFLQFSFECRIWLLSQSYSFPWDLWYSCSCRRYFIHWIFTHNLCTIFFQLIFVYHLRAAGNKIPLQWLVICPVCMFFDCLQLNAFWNMYYFAL